MSMAHSLELRVPFLDRQVLAAAQALPRRYRCTGRRGKIALRAAAARRLPPQLADAPKRGFPCRWRTGCGRRNITRWSRPSSPAR